MAKDLDDELMNILAESGEIDVTGPPPRAECGYRSSGSKAAIGATCKNCHAVHCATTDEDRSIKISEHRESLSILAVTGTTKEYLGKNFSLGDISKLPDKDIERLYRRYQAVLAKQINDCLVDRALSLATCVVAYVRTLDSQQQRRLLKALKKDRLVRNELSALAGRLAYKAGPLVALTNALCHVVNHSMPTKQDSEAQVLPSEDEVDEVLEVYSNLKES